MNKQIRRLGVGFLVLYTILFVQLNRIQVFDAQDLRDHELNTRSIGRDFGQDRGSISTADGVVVAQSTLVEGGSFDYQRQYPEGDLYGHITGYFSLNFGTTGVEDRYNEELAGKATKLEFGSLTDIFLDRSTTADLTLTLRHDLQTTAREALGNRRGSVVALDPRTGAILAMWSNPSFDPNVLSSFDSSAVISARDALLDAPGNPLLAKSYRETYFPGSTFKVVTAAAALDNGSATLDSPVYADATGYSPPLTDATISNFAGRGCGGPLRELIRRSCNSGIAQLAAEDLGPEPFVATAERFGFNLVPPIDLPNAAPSNMPTDFGAPLQSVDSYLGRDPRPGVEQVQVYEDTPAISLSAIGQGEVKATPLQMALVAAAVASEGKVPTPHVMAEIRNRDAEVIETNSPGQWRQAMVPASAASLREAMVAVVENGTGTSMAIDGFLVGGKTGTAQIGASREETHAWVIAFAGPMDQPATVAIAVIVEADAAIGQQTGGSTSGPIAKAVLSAALGS